jgi:hypothetical protein
MCTTFFTMYLVFDWHCRCFYCDLILPYTRQAEHCLSALGELSVDHCRRRSMRAVGGSRQFDMGDYVDIMLRFIDTTERRVRRTSLFISIISPFYTRQRFISDAAVAIRQLTRREEAKLALGSGDDPSQPNGALNTTTNAMTSPVYTEAAACTRLLAVPGPTLVSSEQEQDSFSSPCQIRTNMRYVVEST